MTVTVASRELRNNTAGVLDQVRQGGVVTITVNGRPVAQLVPIDREPRRRWLAREDLADRLAHARADAGLRADLRVLAGDDTDDLGPL